MHEFNEKRLKHDLMASIREGADSFTSKHSDEQDSTARSSNSKQRPASLQRYNINEEELTEEENYL